MFVRLHDHKDWRITMVDSLPHELEGVTGVVCEDVFVSDKMFVQESHPATAHKDAAAESDMRPWTWGQLLLSEWPSLSKNQHWHVHMCN